MWLLDRLSQRRWKRLAALAESNSDPRSSELSDVARHYDRGTGAVTNSVDVRSVGEGRVLEDFVGYVPVDKIGTKYQVGVATSIDAADLTHWNRSDNIRTVLIGNQPYRVISHQTDSGITHTVYGSVVSQRLQPFSAHANPNGHRCIETYKTVDMQRREVVGTAICKELGEGTITYR